MLRLFYRTVLCAAILVVAVGCNRADNKCVGIDVSHHNALSRKDWNELREQNVKYVFIKVSEGKSFKDSKRFSHFNNASSRGMITGAYHFFRDDASAKAQYKNYCDARDGMTIGLLPCIDYEDAGFTQSERKRLKILKELNELIYKHDGTYPIIYCNLLEYLKLKILLPRNPFWIEFNSPDLGLGVMKQEVKSFNGQDLDFNYCDDINDINSPH